MRRLCTFAAIAFASCIGSTTGGGGGGTTGPGSGSAVGSGSGSADPFQTILNSRTVNYSAALRIAAMRLTGSLPTLAEVHQVSDAAGSAAQQSAYEALITDYMSRPTFSTQMIAFWQSTMKQGGTPLLDTAPTYAAELAVQNGAYTDLFTGSAGNCPTYSGSDNTFVPGTCGNGGPVAGVLTNPGVMSQFVSNFAFRRVRWIQEIFDCTAFPAEVSATPTDVGGSSPYTGVWPFDSITGGSAARIDFLSTTSIICADCHSTINHIAPLFAYYDGSGNYQTTIQVTTPLVGSPLAMLSDYLPAGQTTAWRYNVAAPDIPTLGQDMAADPAVATCGVARIWNWALGKQDIVDALELVPPATIQSEVTAFTADSYKLKDLIYAVFTSNDFVSF
jgi:hypothetical protein